MFINISHELEVLKVFFARQAAWITTEYASMSSESNITECDIEERLFHPQGAGSAEKLLNRIVINELNSLVEVAMQDAIVRVSGDSFIPESPITSNTLKFIYSLTRNELEKKLKQIGIHLESFNDYAAVQQVREIAEGNKHREGLRPVPKWDKAQKTLIQPVSTVPGSTDTWFSSYELKMQHVHEYMLQCGSFIHALSDISPGNTTLPAATNGI